MTHTGHCELLAFTRFDYVWVPDKLLQLQGASDRALPGGHIFYTLANSERLPCLCSRRAWAELASGSHGLFLICQGFINTNMIFSILHGPGNVGGTESEQQLSNLA